MIKHITRDWIIIVIITILYQLVFSASVYLNWFSGDSMVFQVMGLSILKGNVPYVDLFDHKGVVLYWLNALGIGILPNRLGLLFLCVMNHAISVFFWLKASSLYISDWRRWVPVILGVVLCGVLQGDGNITEMWSLSPISFSMYLMARNIKNKRPNSTLELFIVGVGMGAVLFIRPNNLIPIAWYCVMYVIYSLYRKNIKYSIESSLYIFFGLIATIGVICLAFYCQYGQIEPLFYGTFLFNLKYAHVGALSVKSFLAPYLMLFTFLFFFCLLVLYFTKKGIEKKPKLILLVYVAGSFGLTVYTMSGAYFNHYFVVVVPSFVLLLIFPVFTTNPKVLRNGIVATSFAICICMYSAYSFIPPIKGKVHEKISYASKVQDLDDFIASIPEEEKNDIWNYSGKFLCINTLFHNGIVQKNRIILPFQLNVDKELQEIGTIQEVQPKWLVTSKITPWLNSQDSLFVATYYTKRFSSEVLHEYDIDIYQHN